MQWQSGPDDQPSGAPKTAGAPHLSDVADRFRAAWTDESDPAIAGPELLPVRLVRACLRVLAVDGAGLSMVQGEFRVPLGASDDLATAAERLQFTQGEGPCLQAARERRPLVADAEQLEHRWPQFASELFGRTAYRAILTMPLSITAHNLGALDLYLIDQDGLGGVSMADASIVSDEIANALRDALATTGPTASQWSEEPEPAWLVGPTAQDRSVVWLAIGMAMTKFALTASDALALLRSYSYAHDAMVDDTAAALVGGRLDLAQLQP